MNPGETIGYVMPEWPGQTHVWMWREICHLRELGAQVRLFSTRLPPERDKARHAFADAARAETTYLWPVGLLHGIRAVIGCFLLNPLGFIACIRLALTLPLDQRNRLMLLKLIVPACVLASEVRRGRIKHLHSHAPANCTILCMMVRRMTGVPFSQTINANLEWWGGAMREKIHDAAITFASTQWMYDQIRRDYPELDESRIGLCRLAVDTRKWVPAAWTIAEDGSLRMLSVSRLAASKGQDDLIRAVALVQERGHAIQLRIGGTGPEEAALKSLVAELRLEDTVTFLGSLSEDQYLADMHAADVFALASHCEPLGVVYMEALATATATIGTAAGGVGELIVNDVNGLLVPPRNPPALADAIERLLISPSLRQCLGEGGRRTVEAGFDSRQWAAELYRRIYRAFPGPLPRSTGRAKETSLRVLLIAEGCNPTMTSVPLEGYSHCKAIKERTDALVLTHWRNREALQNIGWVEGKDFAIIDTEWAARPIWKLTTFLRGGEGAAWTTLAAMSVPLYYLFEHQIWKQFGSRIAAGEFDLVHRVIPLSPTVPSLLAAKCARHGVPFIVGPLNGGLPWPKGFDDVRRREREWLSYFRAAYRLLPGYRSTLTCATAIISGSRETQRQLPRSCRAKTFYIPENAIDPSRFPSPSARMSLENRAIKVVFIGRLVPYKGADMLIAAAAPQVESGRITIDILGDGPQMPQLREQIFTLGIESGVRLLGRVDHQAVQSYLMNADLLGFPSIREFGGAVVLEAMAMGVVPIVVSYGGPAELTSPETGFLIDMGSREQITARFRDILSHLVDHPREIESRREPAIHRARGLFSWEYKSRQVLDVYHWVKGCSDTVPSDGPNQPTIRNDIP